jgi:hypothetical protein
MADLKLKPGVSMLPEHILGKIAFLLSLMVMASALFGWPKPRFERKPSILLAAALIMRI